MRYRLYSNMLALLLVQLANYLPPLIILPYISRVLGIDGFGTVSILFSASAIVYIITDYGFSLSSSYWIAKHRKNKRNLSHYFGAVYFAKTFLLVLIFLSMFSFSWGRIINVEGIDELKIWAFVIALSQAYQPVWFFQGIEKMKNVTMFMVASKILYMMFVFIFVKDMDDIFYVFFAFAISNIVATIISITLVYKNGYYISIPSSKRIIRVFKESTPYFFSRASVCLYTSANAFLVGTILGIGQAALYSSAEKLYQAGQSLISPISQSLFPHLARTKDVGILIRIVMCGLAPMVIGCYVCWIYASDILLMIFGVGFDSAADVLRVFMLCSIVTFITGNFGYPAFAIYGRLDLVNKSVYFSGITQLLILSGLYAAAAFSIENVALSILGVESIVMLFRVTAFWVLCNKTKGEQYAA